jgi:antitoxin component YwqK of YwqJK toxin-antitoxin module
MKTVLLASTLSVCAFVVNAQNVPPTDSKLFIDAAEKHYEQKAYKKAVAEYQKIPRNDTNYVEALYGLALAHMLDSNFTASIKACDEGLQQSDKSYEMQFLFTKGSVLDDMDKKDEALNVYNEGIQKYPRALGFQLNKATIYIQQKKAVEAEPILKNIVMQNPYYGMAHYRLAGCALQQGRIVPAMMSLFTSLLVAPEGNHNDNAIKLLSNISKSTDDVTELISDRKAAEEVFAQAEQIITSKIALDKGYKSKCSLDDPIIRQLQALMEVVKYSEAEEDFWMQYYVPMLKEIFTNAFEPTVYYAFSSVQLESIQRYIKKNQKELKDAFSLLNNYLNTVRTTRQLSYEKRSNAEALYHYEDGKLIGKGKLDNKNNLVGDWEFYHANGNVKGKGSFLADGKRTGIWSYYNEQGKLTSKETYGNGVQAGEEITYVDDIITQKAMYANGKLNGRKITYFAIGHVRIEAEYKDDMEDGSYIEYYSNGQKKIEAVMKADKLNGPYKYYYQNGQLQSEANYKDGNLDGKLKNYHQNGQVSYEATYKDGKPTGEAVSYYKNGKPEERKMYKDGKLEGEYITYNDEGVVISQTTYVDDKAVGIAKYYDSDAKLYSTFEYDKNILKVARYFDKQGKQISSSVRKNKNIDLTVYSPQSYKVSNTLYNDAGYKTDKNTFYYSSSKIKEINDYKDGELNGKSIGYYENGNLRYDISYKDDEKDGVAKFYHPNGKLKQIGHYSEGSLSGSWTDYNERGDLASNYYYLNGDLEGFNEMYHANGKLDYEEVYHNGWLTAVNVYDTTGKKIHTVHFKEGNGTYKVIFPNGQTRFEVPYVKGEYHGVYKSYHYDGKPSITKTYKLGLLEGTYQDYYHNGQLFVKGTYKGGERTGKWAYYNEDGKMWKEEVYVDGELNGTVNIYHPNGKVEREIQYKNDERHGTFKRFSEDGQLGVVMYYNEGELTGYSYNDKNGTLVPKIALPGGNGKIKSYYANGNVSCEVEYLDNMVNGVNKLYHSNGKLIYQLKDDNGYSNGPLTEYYPNGSLKSEYTYYFDKQDGPFKEYYENGKVKEQGQFYIGTPNGTFTYYDETGKVKEKRTFYYGTIVNVSK